jgi:pullulanase/glycogen debranching enzyme
MDPSSGDKDFRGADLWRRDLPMLLFGIERARTQGGNNNAY